MKNCGTATVPGTAEEGYRGGSIALGPAGNPIVAKLETFFTEVYGFKTKKFANVEEMDKFVLKKNYGSPVDANGNPDTLCIGIIFDEAAN